MNPRFLPALVALAVLAGIAVVFAIGRGAPDDRLVETGVVVGVDAASLTEVLGFTLRTSDGRTIDFTIGQLENPGEFPPEHLAVHLADSSPIRVTFRLEGEDRVVSRLEDAT